jgi:formate dehydrogenase iron-sulfur subunit
MKQPMAMLIDVTRCTGCEQCVVVCKQENGLGKDRPWPGQGPIDGLSATRFTTVLRRPGNHFVRQQCRHCQEPACVSACIVGAMQKTPEGPVICDADKCIGCRYCMLACPYGVPRYDWEQSVHSIQKCTLCHERIKHDRLPACVDACPEKATSFGPRSDMLAEADRRLAAHPDRYLQRVYGRNEVGGTCVLYISDVPLDFLGWKPELGEKPLPDLTWAALEKVPWIVFGMGGLMVGLNWVIRRRMHMEALSASQAAEKQRSEGAPNDDASETS